MAYPAEESKVIARLRRTEPFELPGEIDGAAVDCGLGRDRPA